MWMPDEYLIACLGYVLLIALIRDLPVVLFYHGE